jgi:predicted transglutaminase-like cysteine proteinase
MRIAPAVPALCAFVFLNLPGVAEALNSDESQFTGWLHAIAEMHGQPITFHSRPIPDFGEQLARVNREINRVQYTQVFEAYWETPSEFLKYGGQCRDYAVAKYAQLHELGVADADMALTVVRIKATGEYHAVLLVQHGGAVYVLDNLKRTVQGAARLKDFEIVYFINRIGWGQSGSH